MHGACALCGHVQSDRQILHLYLRHTISLRRSVLGATKRVRTFRISGDCARKLRTTQEPRSCPRRAPPKWKSTRNGIARRGCPVVHSPMAEDALYALPNRTRTIVDLIHDRSTDDCVGSLMHGSVPHNWCIHLGFSLAYRKSFATYGRRSGRTRRVRHECTDVEGRRTDSGL